MLFASSFGTKQPNTLFSAETMGGFCLLAGKAVISDMAANHTANPVHVDASVWDSPRQDDATNARIVTLADSGMADDRGFVPGLVLNTWILESRDTGKFAGYGLAEINNCTGRSRSKERLRRT